MKVKTFDEEAILEDLKQSGKMEAVELIKAYKQTIEDQHWFTAQAVNKIRDLNRRIEKDGTKTV